MEGNERRWKGMKEDGGELKEMKGNERVGRG